jgi:hypothetical protein
MKTAWCWHKTRHINQWNRTEDAEISPHTYNDLTFDSSPKNIIWRKNDVEKLDIHM